MAMQHRPVAARNGDASIGGIKDEKTRPSDVGLSYSGCGSWHLAIWVDPQE